MREAVKHRVFQVVRMLPLLALGIVLFPSAAHAQASITGVARDTSGAVIPGVTVEAASPVLIEKVRSAVTDGNGRYDITNLRPGTYTVTFTLPGFNTVKKDNVTVAGSGATVMDAALRVGAVEETITVTGETPVVDVASTAKQSVLDHDAVQALPTSRNYATLARLVPGTTGGTNDVGGSIIADVGGSVQVHGSKAVDQRITLNGVSIMTLQAGGNIGGQQPDAGSAAEITVDTSSLSAEMSTGGVRINFIPKDGGNTFSDSTFFTFSNQHFQGNNFTDALKAAGLATPNAIDNNFDLNESVGGPLRRDHVWFYFSTRFNQANTYAGIFANKNAYDPTQWLYVPDPTKPAENKGTVQQNNLRVTWQVSPRSKVAFEQKMDHWCNCPMYISATRAPEAGNDRRFPRLRQEHAEYTGTLTNRLLIEAVGMHLFERWGNMDLRSTDAGGSLTDAAQAAAYPQLISVTEQSNGLQYRGFTTFNNTRVPNYTYRVAASYVTGTHAFKAGWNDTFGYLYNSQYAYQPVSYRFNNGVPNQLTEYSVPYNATSNEDHDFGVFGQDAWKLPRTTVNLALRYDYFATSFPDQALGAAPLVPNRNLSFPAAKNLGWKDLTWRTGITWDPMGQGKTAIKLSANKYLLGQTLNGLGTSPNPINALATSTTRNWADANKNFVPDCVLTNPLANGECGVISTSTFGTSVPGATFDPDLLGGWNHRQANYEFQASIQQQLMARMSIDVGYFRRIWNNFQATDNTSLAASDFTQFSMVAPVDSRLPGGGNTITGIYNVVPAKFGLGQNYNTLADKYGKQYEHWNGVDVTLNARLRSGLTFQAGMSTGKNVTDNCAVVAVLPEELGTLPAQFCHQAEPFLTQFKGYGSYTIPHIGVQTAVTFRSVPGPAIASNFTATNAYLAANSTLGRVLSGAAANATVQLIAPVGQQYLDRDNQLDLRFGKVLRMGRARSTINLDLYNALNRSTILSANATYASWLVPTSISNPRLAKISMTFDFK